VFTPEEIKEHQRQLRLRGKADEVFWAKLTRNLAKAVRQSDPDMFWRMVSEAEILPDSLEYQRLAEYARKNFGR